FAQLVIDRTPALKGTSAADLLARTTVAASTNGNAIMFTVSDPSKRGAQSTATRFAVLFPAFIQGPPKGKLAKAEANLQNLQNEQRDPQKYGPFLHDPTTKQLVYVNGKLKTDPAQLALLPGKIAAAQATVSTLTNEQPSPKQATYTIPSPATSATQTQPQVTKTALIGLFAGLVLGIFLAFLQDVLDTRIRSAEDVGRRLRVPLLARVPATPRQAGKQLVMLAPPGPALVPSFEAYRIAKLNLTGILERTGAKAIMFTSASDNEGTSQTVANLAIVLARSGKHVILVDANMRESAQAEAFGLDNREGLSDILSGHGRLADTLTAVEVSRPRTDLDASTNGHSRTEGILEILPAGSPAPDPAELLDTRTAGDLLAALRQRADVVLVDAPAMLPVTDAMVLASKVDAVVLVSRARRASRPNVVAMRRALDNCPAPALGFVFAGDSSGRRNDYGGSYMPARPYSPTDEERDPREIGVL
ncbi:MAG: hypothetical protein ACTHNU_08550, partial [Gaiellales bacterium]